jgi:hypothetical protein
MHHGCAGANQVYAIGILTDAPIAGPYLLLFLKQSSSMQGENSIEREFFQPHRRIGRIMLFQNL